MLIKQFARAGESVFRQQERTEEKWGNPEILIAKGPHSTFLEVKDNDEGFWKGRDFQVFWDENDRTTNEDPILKIGVSGETFRFLHYCDGIPCSSFEDRVFIDRRDRDHELGRFEIHGHIREFLCHVEIFTIQLLRSAGFNRNEMYTVDKPKNTMPIRAPYKEG